MLILLIHRMWSPVKSPNLSQQNNLPTYPSRWDFGCITHHKASFTLQCLPGAVKSLERNTGIGINSFSFTIDCAPSASLQQQTAINKIKTVLSHIYSAKLFESDCSRSKEPTILKSILEWIFFFLSAYFICTAKYCVQNWQHQLRKSSSPTAYIKPYLSTIPQTNHVYNNIKLTGNGTCHSFVIFQNT